MFIIYYYYCLWNLRWELALIISEAMVLSKGYICIERYKMVFYLWLIIHLRNFINWLSFLIQRDNVYYDNDRWQYKSCIRHVNWIKDERFIFQTYMFLKLLFATHTKFIYLWNINLKNKIFEKYFINEHTRCHFSPSSSEHSTSSGMSNAISSDTRLSSLNAVGFAGYIEKNDF